MLIDSAFNHFKIRGSRSNEGIKRALASMIASGIKGIITSDDLNGDDFSNPLFLPTLKLELARLEFIRKNQKNREEYNTLPLPPGPLAGMSFTRNLILERAILKGLSKSDGSSVQISTKDSPSSFNIDINMTSSSTSNNVMGESSSSSFIFKPKMISKSTQTKAPKNVNISMEAKEKSISPYLLKKYKLNALATDKRKSTEFS